MSVRSFAKDALKRLFENPFCLQKVTGVLSSVKVPIVQAILSVHPEWQAKPVSKDEVDSFAKAVLYLPPVGGKILVIEDGEPRSSIKRLNSSMLAEEQIKILAELRQRKKVGEFYVHQLTVQGRLPDEFKYIALALILNSPYSNDWSKPFFNAPWGHVAPLVHDGGSVKTDLNPYWKDVKGRTDFLQITVLVQEPNLEALEEEHDRLVIESKAYQRLALCLHCKIGTAPNLIPRDVRARLSINWETFMKRMRMLLGEYDILGSAKVTWFNNTPQHLKGWNGLRYEAEWGPIKKELTHLEQSCAKYPQLQQQVRNLLKESTHIIDREIGLLPKDKDSQN